MSGTRRICRPILRVRADIIAHARNNMYVNISHAWFKMADYIRTHRTAAGSFSTSVPHHGCTFYIFMSTESKWPLPFELAPWMKQKPPPVPPA